LKGLNQDGQTTEVAVNVQVHWLVTVYLNEVTLLVGESIIKEHAGLSAHLH
jgi:hypothetical protein